MKRLALTLTLVWVCFLFGCAGEDRLSLEAMAFRERLVREGCSFQTKVAADLGDSVCEFTMQCRTDSRGDLEFTVTQPELIQGIGGRVTGQKGTLVFDERVLAFPLLAQGELSAVSAPWLLMNGLRSGSIVSVSREEPLGRLTLADTFLGERLRLEVWFDEQWLPVRGELIWDGRRAVSMDITDFVFV